MGLRNFFDTQDILEGTGVGRGDPRASRRRRHARVRTDAYATREWCRIEVLEAKRAGAPVVVLDALEQLEARGFPYLGNAPSVRWRGDGSRATMEALLNVILREALRSDTSLCGSRTSAGAYGIPTAGLCLLAVAARASHRSPCAGEASRPRPPRLSRSAPRHGRACAGQEFTDEARDRHPDRSDRTGMSELDPPRGLSPRRPPGTPALEQRGPDRRITYATPSSSSRDRSSRPAGRSRTAATFCESGYTTTLLALLRTYSRPTARRTSESASTSAARLERADAAAIGPDSPPSPPRSSVPGAEPPLDGSPA